MMNPGRMTTHNNPHAGDDRLIRMKEVLLRTGLTRGGVYARMARKEFPGSVSLGGRAVAWLESDITAWVRERILESRELPEQ